MNESQNSHLIRGFKLSYFWWDMVIVLKRLVFGLFSQFLFSNLDSSSKTLTLVIVLFAFFAVDVMIEPYQLGNMTKHSWNFTSILLLLCQSFVFDRNEDDRNIFLILCFAVLCFCLVASGYHILIELKNRKKIRITYAAAEQLTDQTKREAFLVYSERKMEENGELEIALHSLSRINDTDITSVSLAVWQFGNHVASVMFTTILGSFQQSLEFRQESLTLLNYPHPCKFLSLQEDWLQATK
jgi:hypothetical protein